MKRISYELLVRHNIQTGAVQGTHVKFYDWATDANGAIVPDSGKDGDAMSLAAAEALCFPLTSILSQIEVGALLAMEQAQAEKAELAKALNAEKDAHEATKATLAAVEAELAKALKA